MKEISSPLSTEEKSSILFSRFSSITLVPTFNWKFTQSRNHKNHRIRRKSPWSSLVNRNSTTFLEQVFHTNISPRIRFQNRPPPIILWNFCSVSTEWLRRHSFHFAFRCQSMRGKIAFLGTLASCYMRLQILKRTWSIFKDSSLNKMAGMKTILSFPTRG